MRGSTRGFSRGGSVIDVSDIVQYLYCPRKVYFIKVAGIRLQRPKMEEGKKAQAEVERNLRRFAEKIGGELETGIYLESQRYGLKGLLDAMINADSAIYPVDVKLSRFDSLSYSWKMQLTAYAMLLEENSGKSVRQGYIYIVGTRKLIEVRIEPEDRRALMRIIREVKEIIESEKYPSASRSKKCNYCEVFDFCV